MKMFHSLHRNDVKNTFHLDQVDVNDECYSCSELYLAVIFYTDGGTFGCTHGYYYIVGAYKSLDEAKKELEKAKNNGEYKPWEGYFASFESSDIFVLPVVD